VPVIASCEPANLFKKIGDPRPANQDHFPLFRKVRPRERPRQFIAIDTNSAQRPKSY
jgi:hypothetical protein